MAKIDELLQELCPDGVEWKTLGEVSNLSRGKVYSKSYITNNAGSYPVYSSQTKNEGVLGNISTFDYDGEFLTWTTDGAYAGSVFHRNCKFSITNVCGLIKLTSDSISYRFLYYWLSIHAKEYVYEGMGNPKLMTNQMISVTIPLPPLPIQQHIVEVLDTFTDAISNLEEELALREKQFEHYREQLFNFDDETSLGKQLYSSLIDWQTLSEVAEIGTGSSNTKDGLSQGLYPLYTRGQDILWKNEYEFDEEAVITAGDGVGVGKTIHYITGKYALHQRAYRFSPKKTLLGKFLFYYMKVSFYQYVCGQSVSSSVSSLRKPKLMAYPIPILPIEKQQEIVEILDTFEAMIANLKEEIALRTKQYEYYREKLLSFGK